MSGLTYPSFSVSWYEPRLFGLDRDINPVFWDMPSPNRWNLYTPIRKHFRWTTNP